MKQESPARELSVAERMKWGVCPVCKAVHGEACNSMFGIQLGVTLNGGRTTDGVHLARIQAAPFKVAEVGVES